MEIKPETTKGKSGSNGTALVVLTTLFFMWGFMTILNDILIPHFKEIFQLSYFQAMLVQFSFFGAYFVGSLIYFIVSAESGDPINKIGYKNGIIAGLLLSALGTVLFYPAAEFVSYTFFLTALFILGLGFTILQIAANPYVAVLGSPETASSRLNLAQGFNSLGTTLAPLIGGFLIFKFFIKEGVSPAESVKIPYLIYTVVFILLAVLIGFTKLPRFRNLEKIDKGAGALKYNQLVFGMIAIFLYVGGEVSIGSMLINYLGLENIANLPKEEGSTYLAFYWGGLMIGRFLGAVSLSGMKSNIKHVIMIFIPVAAFLIIFYLKGIDIALIYGVFLLINLAAFFAGKSIPQRTLTVFAMICFGLLIVTLLTNGKIAMWTVLAIGLFNSIMWSNIFTLSIAGLKEHTSQGSSLLVMAIVGGAILPVIQGAAADAIGPHLSFVVPMLSYVYIAFYGLYGYRQKVRA